jgi:hypothetical protein
MNILNIIISSILIYGIFSWPGLGFVGAGLGLTIARYIGALATIWVLMTGFNPALRISLKSYFKPFNFAIIWEDPSALPGRLINEATEKAIKFPAMTLVPIPATNICVNVRPGSCSGCRLLF